MRSLKGDALKAFKKKLEDSTPPIQSSNKSAEMIFFIRKASNLHKPSFSGFGGLDRSEIKLSFENYKAEFIDFNEIEEIGWAIEFLDESLKQYFNKKTTTTSEG